MSTPTAILEFTPTMRGLIENVIEDLILLLDEIDGDADFETAGEDDDVNEDGDHCDDGEQEDGVFFEPWEGFRAMAGAGR